MEIKDIDIFEGGKRPFVIAGPCSAESEEQVMAVASSLATMGVGLFRAGIWKPRTRPGCFEGVGARGLEWLANVKKEYSMPVTTEVATAVHVEAALAAGIDVLWVGARTVTNPFAVQEIAEALRGVDVPVLVKNPVNPDIDLWVGAFERLYNCGVSRLGAIHRGFSAYGEKFYRNAPQWQIPLELKNRFPHLFLVCDPSHIAGKSELVQELAQQAMDLNFDALMVEVHHEPACALSDARQQITPAALGTILSGLVHRSSSGEDEEFAAFRNRIDAIDKELVALLAKRMEVSREIGSVKREKGVTVFQPFRYKETMERCALMGAKHNLDSDVVKEVFEAIHSESIRQQLLIVNGEKND
ncbi:MAG: bifunctional 3-deoxy-7-phosphoheptulonate synthase/chorismate mutase type II [Bacteroidaceae bacterium]|nr:bifunctional 3-deoxy-7-phosphoheptulonate synthase/chorismate mutase type II [Bacteroidaceae bacterium]